MSMALRVDDSATSNDVKTQEDYVVEIPELALIPRENWGFKTNECEFSELDTDSPTLRIGDCIFKGKFQPMLGTKLIIKRPEATSAALAGVKRGRDGISHGDISEDDDADIEDATHASALGPSDQQYYRLVSLTSTRLVFTLVSGHISQLLKAK